MKIGGYIVLFYPGRVIEVWPLFAVWPLFRGGLSYRFDCIKIKLFISLTSDLLDKINRIKNMM